MLSICFDVIGLLLYFHLHITFIVLHWSYFNSENSTKLIQAIAWHQSTSSSKLSSCKSLVSSSSKSSSTWTEFKNDLFDDYGGMDSGSHALTLGRLYAWEKKLYEEVKVSYFCWKQSPWVWLTQHTFPFHQAINLSCKQRTDNTNT